MELFDICSPRTLDADTISLTHILYAAPCNHDFVRHSCIALRMVENLCMDFKRALDNDVSGVHLLLTQDA